VSQYRLVAQLDEWGCGIACIASLLDISYEDAYWLARREKGDSIAGGSPGTELHHIAMILQEMGIHVFADWQEADDFPAGTILFVEGPEPYDGGHYILRTHKGWMDPWANIRNADEARKAKIIKGYPAGTKFSVALVPKSGCQFIQADTAARRALTQGWAA